MFVFAYKIKKSNPNPFMLSNFLEKLSESERRFLAAIILTLILSATLKKKKGTLHNICACIILYITFGYLQMLYFFIAIFINLNLLIIFRFKEYSLTVINFAILYLFKIFGKDFYPHIQGTCDISGILMLLTIKMSYLGRDFDNKKHTLLDAIGYIVFIPGLILGPTTTFIEFIETPVSTEIASPLPTFISSAIFLVLIKITENFFPVSVLYKKNINIGTRLLNLYFYNLGQRFRFYFAWHYSNGCYILQGFNDMLNIKFFRVETATCIKDLSLGWNIKTNKWLKECYFDKIKHRNIFLASFVTFTVSALWHGVKPGYLIMFLSFCFSIPVIKGVNRIILKYASVLYPILSRIQMIFFIMYFSVPFFLLDVSKIYKVWSSVYFYGHIYCAFALYLIYLL